MVPLVIAHRGDSAHRPENTLASFASALELGRRVHGVRRPAHARRPRDRAARSDPRPHHQRPRPGARPHARRGAVRSPPATRRASATPSAGERVPHAGGGARVPARPLPGDDRDQVGLGHGRRGGRHRGAHDRGGPPRAHGEGRARSSRSAAGRCCAAGRRPPRSCAGTCSTTRRPSEVVAGAREVGTRPRDAREAPADGRAVRRDPRGRAQASPPGCVDDPEELEALARFELYGFAHQPARRDDGRRARARRSPASRSGEQRVDHQARRAAWGGRTCSWRASTPSPRPRPRSAAPASRAAAGPAGSVPWASASSASASECT